MVHIIAIITIICDTRYWICLDEYTDNVWFDLSILFAECLKCLTNTFNVLLLTNKRQIDDSIRQSWYTQNTAGYIEQQSNVSYPMQFIRMINGWQIHRNSTKYFVDNREKRWHFVKQGSHFKMQMITSNEPCIESTNENPTSFGSKCPIILMCVQNSQCDEYQFESEKLKFEVLIGAFIRI